jgi:hypothetical protein
VGGATGGGAGYANAPPADVSELTDAGAGAVVPEVVPAAVLPAATPLAGVADGVDVTLAMPVPMTSGPLQPLTDATNTSSAPHRAEILPIIFHPEPARAPAVDQRRGFCVTYRVMGKANPAL